MLDISTESGLDTLQLIMNDKKDRLKLVAKGEKEAIEIVLDKPTAILLVELLMKGIEAMAKEDKKDE